MSRVLISRYFVRLCQCAAHANDTGVQVNVAPYVDFLKDISAFTCFYEYIS